VQRNSNTNQSEVEFFLTAEGGRRFAQIYRRHVGDYLAVVLDNRVMSVAVIKSQISGQWSD